MVTAFEKTWAINEYETRMNREIESLIAKKRLSGENIEKAKARVTNIAKWLETLAESEYPNNLMQDNEVFENWMFTDVALKARTAGIQ
jgi:non-homologous end joining protein Ku